MKSTSTQGFTLVELLTCLLILGVISTFTIPKVFMAQQKSLSNAKAKETLGMVSEAFQRYQASGEVSANTKLADLTPYMNYLRVDTATPVDDHVNANSAYNCSTTLCLKLHNGGILFSQSNARSFGGTSATNAILLFYDPDGVREGISTDSPSKSLAFFLYANGGLTSRANVRPGTTDSAGSQGASPLADPSWFSW